MARLMCTTRHYPADSGLGCGKATILAVKSKQNRLQGTVRLLVHSNCQLCTFLAVCKLRASDISLSIITTRTVHAQP